MPGSWSAGSTTGPQQAGPSKKSEQIADRREMMVAREIYAHARRAPDKVAIIHDSGEVSYAQFAGLIEATRRHLAEQKLPSRSLAVLTIRPLLKGWIVGLAARSLGLA